MSDWVKGRVAAKQQWAEGLYSMRFEATLEPFSAGQYIKVAMDIDGERVGRPYSLVNPPGQAEPEIYFNAIPEGPLTPRLSDLEPGDTVWLSARASGIFTLDTVQPAKTLWLLATGTALGVYLSILRTATPWEQFERVVLVHGVRQPSDLTYGDTLAEIVAHHGERFTFIPAISRAEAPDALYGRITDLLVSGTLEARAGATITPEDSHVMLCGNSAMIKESKAILESRGLERHRRHAPGQYTTEQYH
ncbi:ferredoxin-NADP reductase [Marichromatium purpuratum 984]|uniref:ferredoxin--NADP(+) reductase n=1 Tax=Marichromatium purpuratum 984 TaxID=765910 RepID=W0E0W9_MARPU|nr:ferredoxin--NADP reductase [Marichromatium purpuratum]AHF04352.1 ferredoxin-NADP reductase [Marichromatium purpuratum 984]